MRFGADLVQCLQRPGIINGAADIVLAAIRTTDAFAVDCVRQVLRKSAADWTIHHVSQLLSTAHVVIAPFAEGAVNTGARDEAFLIAVNIAKLPSVPRLLKDIPRPPNSASRDD